MVLLSGVHCTRSHSSSTSISVVVLLSGVHSTRGHSCSSSVLVVVLLSGVHCTGSHSCSSSILVVVLLSGVHSTRSHCCSILVVVFLLGVHCTRNHSCSILVVVVICLSHLFTFVSVISGWFLQAEETWGHADVPSREEAAKDVGRLWRWWGVEPAISCISASAAFHQPAVLISWKKRTLHSRLDDHSWPQVAVPLELPDIPRDLKGREERKKRTEKDIQMCRHTRFHELMHVYYVSRLRNHVTSMYDYFSVRVFIFLNYMFSLLWEGRWEDGVACSLGQAVSVWFWFIHSSEHYGIIFAFIHLVCLTCVC